MTSDQNINETIGGRLKALRISRGVPQSEIADLLGCKSNRVTRIERGISHLTAAELVRVAKKVGVRTSQLVGEEPVTGGAKP